MDAVNELRRILDRESVVVELVLFRLKAMELLLSAGEHRFLNDAAEELDQAVDRLEALETMRGLSVEELAQALGMPVEECALTDVLRLADERQRGELVTSQVRLSGLLRELEGQTALARDLALARVAAVRAALERLSRVPGSRYGRDGIVPGRGGNRSFDERL
ncbi:MAG TPA: flagellar export chaperone FlgN [Egibacteraceae bacterium]|nr:flagellar export chaperone FlgN [Egibacteraceae bacterium]